jgi:hypothetical protein
MFRALFSLLPMLLSMGQQQQRPTGIGGGGNTGGAGGNPILQLLTAMAGAGSGSALGGVFGQQPRPIITNPFTPTLPFEAQVRQNLSSTAQSLVPGMGGLGAGGFGTGGLGAGGFGAGGFGAGGFGTGGLGAGGFGAGGFGAGGFGAGGFGAGGFGAGGLGAGGMGSLGMVDLMINQSVATTMMPLNSFFPGWNDTMGQMAGMHSGAVNLGGLNPLTGNPTAMAGGMGMGGSLGMGGMMGAASLSPQQLMAMQQQQQLTGGGFGPFGR